MTLTKLLAIAALLSGCYTLREVGDDPRSPASGDGPGSPIDEDGDGSPDAVVLDESVGAPDEDLDGDGTTNEIDTDDDGDGLADAVDVDVDGDGAPEEAPPAEVIAAAWDAVTTFCSASFECCTFVAMGEYTYEGVISGCQTARFGEILSEFTQAAATAGATVDHAAWEAENAGPTLPRQVGCGSSSKADVSRLRELDEHVLPYFHGTGAIGEPCFTLWDCDANARCEGLAPGSGEPGTCAPRPVWDGPCAASEPYCRFGQTCAVKDGAPVCEVPRQQGDFCGVFEHAGRTTDDCAVWSWCDDALETPACRSPLYEGDSCEEDRQCGGLECDELTGECGEWEFVDLAPMPEDLLTEWCPGWFPTLEFAEP